MSKRKIKLFESYSNTYRRKIPRDFFNEAKLLKCMGLLSVKVLDNKIPEGIDIEVNGDGDRFNIELNETYYGLQVTNYTVSINEEDYVSYTAYNSKDNFPLMIVDEDDYEFRAFDEQGNFSEDFIEYFTQ